MYYVYAYLNPLKPGNYDFGDIKFDFEPFYIGKGKNYRLKHHLSAVLNNSASKYNILKSTMIEDILNSDNIPIISKVYENLTDSESCGIECKLIKKIGRIVTNDGTLTNITGGGEFDTLTNHPDRINILKKMSASRLGKPLKKSTVDKIRKNHQSDEYRKNMSEIIKTYYETHDISDETKSKISESLLSKKITRSEYTKNKIGDTNRNRKHTLLSKKNMSLGHIGLVMPKRVKYIMISPSNDKYEFIGEKYFYEFIEKNKMSIRIIRENLNKGKIVIKRKTDKSLNTEGWVVEKYDLNN